MMAKDEPMGIVFLYNQKIGDEKFITDAIKPYLTQIVKNLLSEGYITRQDHYNKIFDGGFIYFTGLEEAYFDELINDNSKIGMAAFETFKINTDVEPSEEVEVIHYLADKAPWKFDLFVSVVYSF